MVLSRSRFRSARPFHFARLSCYHFNSYLASWVKRVAVEPRVDFFDCHLPVTERSENIADFVGKLVVENDWMSLSHVRPFPSWHSKEEDLRFQCGVPSNVTDSPQKEVFFRSRRILAAFNDTLESGTDKLVVDEYEH
jgi:hypothetical protein